MKVANKTAVVTGGGSGIGRELVLHLLAKGASVIAVDINEKALKETMALAKEHSQLTIFVLDISNEKKVLLFSQQIKAKFGEVDILINNAGVIQPFVLFHQLDSKKIDTLVNVNFYGVLFMIRAFLPLLEQCPQAHIVNVSSVGGFVPVPGQTLYGATKAAVKILTEGLQYELADSNIKVSLVLPGAIDTNIAENSGVQIKASEQEMQRLSKIKRLSPQKAAQTIVKAIEKNRSRVFIGADAKFIDMLYRISPTLVGRLIYKQMKGLLP